MTVISCLPLYVGQGLGDAAIAPQFAYTHSTLYQTDSGEKSETHEIRHLVRPYTNTCTHGRTLTTLYQKTLENTQWRKQMQSGLGDDAVAPQQTNIPPQNGEFLKCLVAEIFLKL